jgi:hypothetical protein
MAPPARREIRGAGAIAQTNAAYAQIAAIIAKELQELSYICPK